MITSLFPNFSEMGDIANLVNEDIDSIILTGETAYGAYPI
jgi:pyruvate kinase